MHNKLFQNQLAKVSPEIQKEMEWAASIVDRIDCILKEKGMTHRDLAKMIGCNETQIVRWTRGFPNYTISTLSKLSVALGEDLITVNQTGPVVTGYHTAQAHTSQYLSDNHMPVYGTSDDSVKISK